jgi:hypothetical protein
MSDCYQNASKRSWSRDKVIDDSTSLLTETVLLVWSAVQTQVAPYRLVMQIVRRNRLQKLLHSLQASAHVRDSRNEAVRTVDSRMDLRRHFPSDSNAFFAAYVWRFQFGLML